MTKEQAEKCLVNREKVFYTNNDGESKEVLITAVTPSEVLIAFEGIFENMDDKYAWVGLEEVEYE